MRTGETGVASAVGTGLNLASDQATGGLEGGVVAQQVERAALGAGQGEGAVQARLHRVVDPGHAEAQRHVAGAVAAGDHHRAVAQGADVDVPEPGGVAAIGDAGIERDHGGTLAVLDGGEDLVPAGGVFGEQEPHSAPSPADLGVAGLDDLDSGDRAAGDGGVDAEGDGGGPGRGGVGGVAGTANRQRQVDLLAEAAQADQRALPEGLDLARSRMPVATEAGGPAPVGAEQVAAGRAAGVVAAEGGAADADHDGFGRAFGDVADQRVVVDCDDAGVAVEAGRCGAPGGAERADLVVAVQLVAAQV